MIDIDPTVDFACKMLLGNPEHPSLTIHFLNAVISPEVPIIDVEYLNPIIPQEFEQDKLAILDILAQDQQGRRFNVEVQRTVPGWLPERLAYYIASQLVEQIGEGDNYHQLCPSIGICLLKGQLFPAQCAYHHQFRLRTVEGLELTHCLEIHTLELPKYPHGSDNVVVSDPLEQWMDFFCCARGQTASAIKKRLASPIFDEAVGVLEMISRTPEQRRFYQARLKWELDENTRRAAEAAARAESEARGRVEGRVEERIKQIQILRSLLNHQPVEDAGLACLTLEQLELIINDLQSEIRNRLG